MPFAATAGQAQEIWRVPVVVSNAMAEGEFLLGDWTIGAKIYAREGVSVRVSESHADYFVKNGVAILAEERYCLAVNRPKAFTKGAFTVAA
jgi:HK97 family phage major capsid protein